MAITRVGWPLGFKTGPGETDVSNHSGIATIRDSNGVVTDVVDGTGSVASAVVEAAGVPESIRTAVVNGYAGGSGSTDKINSLHEAAHFVRQVTLAPTMEEINDALAVGSRRAYLLRAIYGGDYTLFYPLKNENGREVGAWPWAVVSTLSPPVGTTTPINFAFAGQTLASRLILTTFLGDSEARAQFIEEQAPIWGVDPLSYLTSQYEAPRLKATWVMSKFIPVSVPGGAFDAPDKAIGMMAWYSTLHRYCFRNYADLLEEVTYSFPMSAMLTYTANRKQTGDSLPDENYARELMQLFTLGLWELNIDGTQKLDSDGQPIPTYTQQDIQQVARVFTGLCRFDRPDADYTNPAQASTMAATGLVTMYQEAFFRDLQTTQYSNSTYQTPAAGVAPRLRHYIPFYETGAKYALNGLIDIPADTAPQTNIRMAIDALVAHPSCAPFVAKNLIKLTVTSNPSPGYVARVASVFENNGRGERGDLAAVFLAIWTDAEASNTIRTSETHGRVRDGFEQYASFVRGMHRHSFINHTDNQTWFEGVRPTTSIVGPLQDEFLQGSYADWPMYTPSIFGFHSLEYSRSPARDWGLKIPEMQSKSDGILMRASNETTQLLRSGTPAATTGTSTMTPRCHSYAAIFGADYTTNAAAGVRGMVETANLLFCGGTLTTEDKVGPIVGAAQNMPATNDTQRYARVHIILDMVSKTPEFMVM